MFCSLPVNQHSQPQPRITDFYKWERKPYQKEQQRVESVKHGTHTSHTPNAVQHPFRTTPPTWCQPPSVCHLQAVKYERVRKDTHLVPEKVQEVQVSDTCLEKVVERQLSSLCHCL